MAIVIQKSQLKKALAPSALAKAASRAAASASASASSAKLGDARFASIKIRKPPEAESPTKPEASKKFANVVIRKPQKAEPPPKPEAPKKFANVVIRKAQKGASGLEAFVPGKSFGIDDALTRYAIKAVIGEGGTGRVVLARDQMLDMDVAIKILSPRLVRDETALASLKAEVRITLGLIHKHILRVYNLERSGSNYLVVMEYLKGRSMAQLMDDIRGGMAPDFVVSAILLVADALDYAHRHNVLHLDLTPGNIFLTDDGIVKVIDFGIARIAGVASVADDFIVGTPVFMSPEQIRGDPLDATTDVYSMGVLTFQMLTGRFITSPDLPLATLAAEPHPPVEGLPEPVAAVIEKATAFSPGDRFESTGDFAAALAVAYGIDPTI